MSHALKIGFNAKFKVGVVYKIQTILLTVFCKRNKCTDGNEKRELRFSQPYMCVHQYGRSYGILVGQVAQSV